MMNATALDLGLIWDSSRQDLLREIEKGQATSKGTWARALPHRSVAERGAWGVNHGAWLAALNVSSDEVTDADRGPVVGVVICNQSRDYRDEHATKMVDWALAGACALRKLGSRARLWALTYGFDGGTLARLRHGGFRVHDFSHVHPARYAMSPLSQSQRNIQLNLWPSEAPYRKMPQTLMLRSRELQPRRDYACTSAKFFAWNLTAHSNVLLVDADVLLREDPLPWMTRHSDELFVAHTEQASRAYVGLNTRMMYLQPNAAVFELLRRASIAGNFVPYTNSEQDVIESVLTSPRNASMPDWTGADSRTTEPAQMAACIAGA